MSVLGAVDVGLKDLLRSIGVLTGQNDPPLPGTAPSFLRNPAVVRQHSITTHVDIIQPQPSKLFKILKFRVYV